LRYGITRIPAREMAQTDVKSPKFHYMVAGNAILVGNGLAVNLL
jgi:hypothetical protein